jgi:hypothetical protein
MERADAQNKHPNKCPTENLKENLNSDSPATGVAALDNAGKPS